MVQEVREFRESDAEGMTRIYNHYVVNTTVSFETSPVRPADLLERVRKVERSELPWTVAEDSGEIVGYAYAVPWHERRAYRRTCEITVYVSPDRAGEGWGTRLYEALFARLEARKIHSVLGVIALPNEGSIALHEKFGMRKVGHFAEMGFKLGRWVDVGYWQRIFPHPFDENGLRER